LPQKGGEVKPSQKEKTRKTCLRTTQVRTKNFFDFCGLAVVYTASTCKEQTEAHFFEVRNIEGHRKGIATTVE
jgi:hypothetical protein